MRIQVALNERVIVHKNGRPFRYLEPGVHRVFAPFSKLEVFRFFIDTLIADLRSEQLELIPTEDVRVLDLGATQRALIRHRGRPARWLGTGRHLIWTAERRIVRSASGVERTIEEVEMEIFETASIEVKPLLEDVKALVPATDYVEITAPESSVALRFVDGALDAVLPAGRHAAWTTQKKVTFASIDLRERLLQVGGQEVMTKDRVTLRLNLSATYKVADPRHLATIAREPDDVLYLAIQFVVRETVASKTLDELLAERDALGAALLPPLARRAREIGLDVVEFGLKDLILPGEMKALLNRVIEAQKAAEANVITRREETAAVRSMANTAKVLSENPILVRLKELEAYKELAAKVGQVHLVVGENGLTKLNLDV